jgi:hypothetical protein
MMARSQPNTMVMLETRAGCPDGIVSVFFEAGKTYTTTERLFKLFIANGWATVPGAEVEEKMMTPAIENKMIPETIADRDKAAEDAKGAEAAKATKRYRGL